MARATPHFRKRRHMSILYWFKSRRTLILDLQDAERERDESRENAVQWRNNYEMKREMVEKVMKAYRERTAWLLDEINKNRKLNPKKKKKRKDVNYR